MPYGFLIDFWETGIHSRTHSGCHMLTFGSVRDNFISIKAITFLHPHSIFMSLMDICHTLVTIYIIYEIEQWFHFVDNEYSTTKRMRPTTKGACGQGGCPGTTSSFSPSRIPSFLSIFSQPHISTWLFSANNPWSMSRLHKFLACYGANSNFNRIGSKFDATSNNYSLTF